jgi:dihydroorotate dehydrogenase (NAD+) catalytic subunit
VIVNIVGATVEEFVELARALSAAGGPAALELNMSCPNVKAGGLSFSQDPKLARKLLAAVRAATKLPLLAKLSPNVTDVVPIARAAAEGGAEALVLGNTLLGTALDARTRRFKLANVTGGLSGPAIKPVALRLVWQVAQALPGLPLVGCGGIVTAEDVAEYLLAGARAVEVGTASFLDPTRAARLPGELAAFLAATGARSAAEIVGKAERA